MLPDGASPGLEESDIAPASAGPGGRERRLRSPLRLAPYLESLALVDTPRPRHLLRLPGPQVQIPARAGADGRLAAQVIGPLVDCLPQTVNARNGYRRPLRSWGCPPVSFLPARRNNRRHRPHRRALARRRPHRSEAGRGAEPGCRGRHPCRCFSQRVSTPTRRSPPRPVSAGAQPSSGAASRSPRWPPSARRQRSVKFRRAFRDQTGLRPRATPASPMRLRRALSLHAGAAAATRAIPSWAETGSRRRLPRPGPHDRGASPRSTGADRRRGWRPNSASPA